jgi:hypothetical protein
MVAACGSDAGTGADCPQGDSTVEFEVYAEGKSLRVIRATFTNGSPTVRLSNKIAAGATTGSVG